MKALRAYSVEPGFSQPVDRWSFAVKQQTWDNVSGGVSQDFGMNVFFRAENDLRVRMVEKTSPAGLAGVRRGWRITKINGNTNITTGNASFIINGVYESANTTFTFQRPDGSSVDLTLNAGSYLERPVHFDSVYTVNNKRVGYMVFNSFLGDTTQVYNDFNRVFNKFASANVTDVVVDLRYNGGGYVSMQEKLANYLINSAHNGSLMMKQMFNDKYSNFNSTAYFRKQGSLNVNRIFFIVSGSTASASELLINNLKPYMDVVLVGPSKTFGKPVGYFPIPIFDWYIFPVSFKTVNKNGEGNYYNGLALNVQAPDGLDKDWGDVNESAFGAILQGFNSGTYRMQAPEIHLDPAVEKMNRRLDEPNFKGTVGKMKF
jgi:C-terminal processing protease CtpA/Prc